MADKPDPIIALVLSLEAELDQRYRLVQLYDDYYEGRHRLAFATSKFREVFGGHISAVTDNWMPMVIQSSVERLRMQGFTLEVDDDVDPDKPDDGDGTDNGAWDICRRNYLDVDFPILATEASKHGEAALLSWWDHTSTPGFFSRLFSRRSTDTRARITLEDPGQMIVRREAGDPRRRAAALKRWVEEDETVMANLYLPGHLYRFRRKKDGDWGPRELDGIPAVETNPLGIVPVVPIVNDPHMKPCLPPQSLLAAPHNAPRVGIGLGRSDLADLISTQDQINKLLCDLMIASEFGAFKQRWATGLETEDESEVPERLRPAFKAAIDHLWTSEDDKTKFGEFSETQLSNFVAAIENRIQSLASRSRTPPHYLLGSSGTFPSGESLKATETGLVAKSNGKKSSFGGGVEEAARIALFIEKGERAASTFRSRVAWASSESRSESEFVDSLVKKLSIGVPKEQLWEEAGYSPEQIKQMKKALREAAVEALIADIGNPQNQGVPPEQQPAPEPPSDAGQ